MGPRSNIYSIAAIVRCAARPSPQRKGKQGAEDVLDHPRLVERWHQEGEKVPVRGSGNRRVLRGGAAGETQPQRAGGKEEKTPSGETDAHPPKTPRRTR